LKAPKTCRCQSLFRIPRVSMVTSLFREAADRIYHWVSCLQWETDDCCPVSVLFSPHPRTYFLPSFSRSYLRFSSASVLVSRPSQAARRRLFLPPASALSRTFPPRLSHDAHEFPPHYDFKISTRNLGCPPSKSSLYLLPAHESAPQDDRGARFSRRLIRGNLQRSD